MSWNFYRIILNVLLQKLMGMEHFEIYIIKLINKIISRVVAAVPAAAPALAPAVWVGVGVAVVVVVVDFGFTSLLTSQVISVAFYSEREKSDKFCSEALISAWGSFMCHKSTTRDPQLYFLSEGNHTQGFYALKNSIDPGRDWICEPRIQWRVW